MWSIINALYRRDRFSNFGPLKTFTTITKRVRNIQKKFLKVFRGSMERLTSGEGKDQCCGNYPAKKPFNSQTHQCIDGEVTQDNFYSNL